MHGVPMLASRGAARFVATMEITCNRCKTEYDFHDALVSERGTTVRCTNCGEQFKVYRSDKIAFPERWVVQRRDGRELVFTNLRDLQRAITNLQVGRHDSLTRGSTPPRPLGSIAELEPFFLGRLGPSGQTASPPAAAPVRNDAVGRGEELPSRSGRTGRPPPGGPAAPAPLPAALPLKPPSNLAPDGESNSIGVGKTLVDPAAAAAPVSAFGDFGANDPL